MACENCGKSDCAALERQYLNAKTEGKLTIPRVERYFEEQFQRCPKSKQRVLDFTSQYFTEQDRRLFEEIEKEEEQLKKPTTPPEPKRIIKRGFTAMLDSAFPSKSQLQPRDAQPKKVVRTLIGFKEMDLVVTENGIQLKNVEPDHPLFCNDCNKSQCPHYGRKGRQCSKW